MKRLAHALILVVLGSAQSFAQHPALEKGFAAARVYEVGDIDAVNTFNGGLMVRLPIGPAYPAGGSLSYALTLVYNSKVWDYEYTTGYPRAVPTRRSNAGPGWLLSMGRLVRPGNATNTTGFWMYESPDGAEHAFSPTLHYNEQATPLAGDVKIVQYTRDDTYLRALHRDTDDDEAVDTVDLEFPDGTVRVFDAATGELSAIRDRHGNSVSIAYHSSAAGTPCSTTNFASAWVMTDTASQRKAHVCFTKTPAYETIYGGQVERVVVTAPRDAAGSARTATYTFGYTATNVARGCYSTHPNDSQTVSQLPLLTSLTLPDGSQYALTYNAKHLSACESAALSSVTVPTGATTSYTYRHYTLPTDQCNRGTFARYPTGIATKTVSGPRIPTATWTYSSFTNESAAVLVVCEEGDFPVYTPAPADELTVTVRDPLGNVTEHYYSTWPIAFTTLYDSSGQVIRDSAGEPIHDRSVNGSTIREFALPFTRRQSSGGNFLSRRVYTATGYDASPRTALRSSYVTYVHDPMPTCMAVDGSCVTPNPRVSAERTVYHDDADRFATTSYSDFDGVGHYRNVVLGGNLGGRREIYTAFNTRDSHVNPTSGLATGSYPGNFTPPTLDDAWILGMAPRVTVLEGAALSASTYRCYDASVGALQAVRVLKWNTPGAADLLTVYGYDDAGNVTSETFHGGDIRSNAPVGESLCATAGAPPAAYDYKLEHQYASGVRTTSRYADASFFTLNRVIDADSGLPSSATDSTGRVTTFTYDTSFRLTRVSPPGVAATTYTYNKASGSGTAASPPSVVQSTLSSSGNVERVYQYDGLGRLWRDKQRMADNSWSVAEISYNAIGWLAKSSERQKLTVSQGGSEYDVALSHWTSYGSYDPFGRTGSVTAPDGSETAFEYEGVRTVSRTISIAGEAGVQPLTPVTTTETYDRQNRLTSVTEAAGTDMASTTTYGYDVGGRLTSVRTGSSGKVQNRTFRYDNRGFLEYAQHPELGSAGNGKVVFGTYDGATGAFIGSYDARGHAHRSVTGAAGGTFDLTFEFDSAERVTRIADGSGRPLKIFDYDDPTGSDYPQCTDARCNGRLAAAARYNYHPVAGTIIVTESYQYDGVGGRPSRRDRTAGQPAGSTGFEGQSFFFTQQYNDLGLTAAITYPCRSVASGCDSSDPARTVSYGYTKGFLTSAGGAATGITYQPNGVIDTVTHANGVSETWSPDPNGLPRPARISAKNAAGVELWSTGAYAYDGAGNISQIGGTAHRYDSFQRLVSTSRAVPGAVDKLTIQYDQFGNQLLSTMHGCSGAPASFGCYTSAVIEAKVVGTTNHYEHFSYGDAGNVLNDGRRTYTYDALGMTIRTVAGTRDFGAIYSPDDERIALFERVATPSGTRNRTTWTLRGFDNQLLRAWTDDATGNVRSFTWKEDALWRGSSLLGYATAAGVRHYALDHLGSPRLVTDASGAEVGKQNFDPFGRGGTTDGGALQFTGHERDAAIVGSGTADLPDYFHARQYDVDTGRFLAVDPVLGNPTVPQSWNRYVYALNNPLKFVDPTGMYVTTCASGDQTCAKEAAAFEAARQDQLGSTDESLRNAAAAYGDPGVDNGVSVSFVSGEALRDRNAVVIAQLVPGEQVSAQYDVRIRSGMSADDLKNVVVHEGEHIRNAQGYVSALQSGVFDPTRNLTLYQTEMNAYMVSWAFARTNNLTLKYNGMEIKGMMPREQLRREIDKFLRREYKLTPDTRRCQFSPCG